MKFLLILASIIVAGCATSKTVPVGPNGKPLHFIKCPAMGGEKCYEKAAEICPTGYAIYDKSGSQPIGVVGNSQTQIAGSGTGSAYRSGPNTTFNSQFSGSATTQSQSFLIRSPNELVIECKGA